MLISCEKTNVTVRMCVGLDRRSVECFVFGYGNTQGWMMIIWFEMKWVFQRWLILVIYVFRDVYLVWILNI